VNFVSDLEPWSSILQVVDSKGEILTLPISGLESPIQLSDSFDRSEGSDVAKALCKHFYISSRGTSKWSCRGGTRRGCYARGKRIGKEKLKNHDDAENFDPKYPHYIIRCHCGGEYHPSSKKSKHGRVRQTHSRQCGCPANIRLRFNFRAQHWFIVACELQHVGHPALDESTSRMTEAHSAYEDEARLSDDATSTETQSQADDFAIIKSECDAVLTKIIARICSAPEQTRPHLRQVFFKLLEWLEDEITQLCRSACDDTEDVAPEIECGKRKRSAENDDVQ
jgi:hypothetical protein